MTAKECLRLVELSVRYLGPLPKIRGRRIRERVYLYRRSIRVDVEVEGRFVDTFKILPSFIRRAHPAEVVLAVKGLRLMSHHTLKEMAKGEKECAVKAKRCRGTSATRKCTR